MNQNIVVFIEGQDVVLNQGCQFKTKIRQKGLKGKIVGVNVHSGNYTVDFGNDPGVWISGKFLDAI